MVLWDQSVEILRQSIFAYAQACNGNLGAGILAVTFLARLALAPLAIRMARTAAAQQAAVKDDKVPAPPSPGGCLGNLAQAPLVIALYSAVRQAAVAGGRFLWIGNLASPDWALAILATLLTLLATATGSVPPAQSRSLMLTVSAIVTIVVLSKMSAGVGLYWALSSLFGAAQGWLVQRSLRSHAA